MGVWIETYFCQRLQDDSNVTPCMGVWIETRKFCKVSTITDVTPCMGVWIETLCRDKHQCLSRSHPVWVCGLKHHRTSDPPYPV